MRPGATEPGRGGWGGGQWGQSLPQVLNQWKHGPTLKALPTPRPLPLFSPPTTREAVACCSCAPQAKRCHRIIRRDVRKVPTEGYTALEPPLRSYYRSTPCRHSLVSRCSTTSLHRFVPIYIYCGEDILHESSGTCRPGGRGERREDWSERQYIPDDHLEFYLQYPCK